MRKLYKVNGFLGVLMSASRVLPKDVLKKFRTVKVLTLPELMLWLDCSQRTAHRRLHDWGAISSYNSNGRYCTSKEVAQFDSNGIWCWQDVRFSRYGNLFETVRGVLDASKGGLTGVEMGEILNHRLLFCFFWGGGGFAPDSRAWPSRTESR